MGTPMNFDPVTGLPLTEEAKKLYGGSQTPEWYNPNPQPVSPSPRKGRMGLVIALVAGGLAFLAVTVLAGFMIFGGRKATVSRAVRNTFKRYVDGDNLLLTDLNVKDILESGDYTVYGDVYYTTEYDDGDKSELEVTANLMTAGEALQLSGDVFYKGGSTGSIPTVEYCLQLDKEELRAYTPLLDQVFVYHYRENNSGYLMDILESSEYSQSELNDALKNLYEASCEGVNKSELYGEFAKAARDSFRDIEYHNGRSAEYEIDGKDVRCRAIEVTVTPENLERYATALDKLIDENYGDALENSGMSARDMTDSIRNIGGEYGDMVLTFYVYRKQLGCIKCEFEKASDETIEILFKGGDYRAQNMEILYKGATILTIEGDRQGDVEEFEMNVDNEVNLTYRYDRKTGELTASMDDGWTEMKLEDVRINRSNKELQIDAVFKEHEDDGWYYRETVDATLKVSKGASIDKLTAREFDLGNASESEFQNLAKDVSNLISEILGY